MTKSAASVAEEFALSTVRVLRESGFQALWAGGCVRDRLLGRVPKDYDIATDATPEQVCDVFGKKRTLRIGEAFGVVAILGKKPLQPIEVATFRKEEGYADGRHPDHVRFSTAEEDAKRRDFTINGMFFDPVENLVIDYVNGQADLKDRIIRCIGNARERLSEDRLRMLRAIRFAAAFEFDIEPQTFSAIQENASHITVVSAERIANEMRRMMAHSSARPALELLHASTLREYILPEFRHAPSDWQDGLAVVEQFEQHTFELTCAAMLRGIFATQQSSVGQIAVRWKLANSEKELILNILKHEPLLRNGQGAAWPKLQRVLVQPFAEIALEFSRAVAMSQGDDMIGIDYCRGKLELPREILDPPALICGDDLIESGIKPGPAFRSILSSIRDQQLNGQIRTKDEAIIAALKIV
jgi:tRNA nucleotidyltransferase/poly(A) polymerase